jgi:cell division transport system permease protein
LVFFEVGIDQEIIQRLKNKWEKIPKIKKIDYTSEEEAFKMYSDYTEKTQPIIYLTLQSNKVTNGKLSSSLDIQIYSLEDLKELTAVLLKDIEEENEKLPIVNLDEQNNSTQKPIYKYSTKEGEPPIELKVDSESLDKLREVMLSLRVAGIAIITLLMVVIFFFTIMTVEFRLYNQMEEIGVMQLVGGSLFFIRAPYILEGGFYGLFGSLIAIFIVGVVLLTIFVLPTNLAIKQFFFENFSQLPWPYIDTKGWIVLIASTAIVGFIVGAFSTWLAIRRYIR